MPPAQKLAANLIGMLDAGALFLALHPHHRDTSLVCMPLTLRYRRQPHGPHVLGELPWQDWRPPT